MKAIEVKKNPSCAEMLRTMEVREEKTFKLLGRISVADPRGKQQQASNSL